MLLLEGPLEVPFSFSSAKKNVKIFYKKIYHFQPEPLEPHMLACIITSQIFSLLAARRLC